ncbi:NHL repeat-containing protein [Maridesulfovibrio frigidus]|uniref:hypothetical protein n=1 Tax=Maridesulfovibrio frigidus TaxID=340956 RepID=UPI0004E22C38|nr:hypothetical protein [Maridesulfovibrio frigidus]
MIRSTFLLYITVCLSALLFGGAVASAEDLYVMSRDSGEILVFDSADDGLSTPARNISGAATLLSGGHGYGLFLYDEEVYITDENDDSISVFPSTGTGNIAPTRVISGAAPGLNIPRGLFISNSEIYIADEGSKSIKVFNTSDSGNVAPKREIVGAATGFSKPCMMMVYGSDLYVLDNGLNLVSVFNVTDTGNVAPKRTFSVSGVMNDARGLWISNDIIYISQGGTDTIMSFPLASSGVTVPSTTISAAGTAVNNPYGLIVKDSLIYVSSFAIDTLVVFKTTDDGLTVPQQVITSATMNGPIQLGMAIEEDYVKKSEHQQAGVTVAVTANTQNATTDTVIQDTFSIPSSFNLRSPLATFTATVSSSGANGVFSFNSTSLNGTVADVVLMKCYEANGTSIPFGSYASVADPDTEGAWWMEDDSENYLPSETVLTLGTNYWVNYVVKDNGKYDTDPTLGVIKDPAALGVQSPSDTGGGCVLNPTAGFGLEWAILMGGVGLLFIRRLSK